MKKQNNKSKKMRNAYWTVVAMLSVLIISVQPVMAARQENIWDRFSTVIRMVSRNQKAVDEATAWLKRIVITWVILNSLGLIVAYLQPLITGGNYTG